MCSSTSSFTTGVTLFITSNIDPPSGLDAPPLSPPHTTLCIITVHSSSMPSILVNVGVGMVMLVDIVVSELMVTTMTMVVIDRGRD